MFAFLRGVVARKAPGHVELDVNGVGYHVAVPDLVSAKLTVDGEATLLTHCYIREDAFTIFGFLREEERTLFKTLLGISGIGPKAALAILSALSPRQVAAAIMENNVAAFTRVPGIGKKGAQRVVLEMKAKLGQDAELEAILGEPEAFALASESDDAIDALCSLGCTLGEARRAATKARQELPADARPEEVVRIALRSMAKV